MGDVFLSKIMFVHYISNQLSMSNMITKIVAFHLQSNDFGHMIRRFGASKAYFGLHVLRMCTNIIETNIIAG